MYQAFRSDTGLENIPWSKEYKQEKIVMNENNTRRAPDIEMMRVKHFQTYLKAFKGRSISFNEYSEGFFFLNLI